MIHCKDRTEPSSPLELMTQLRQWLKKNSKKINCVGVNAWKNKSRHSDLRNAIIRVLEGQFWLWTHPGACFWSLYNLRYESWPNSKSVKILSRLICYPQTSIKGEITESNVWTESQGSLFLGPHCFIWNPGLSSLLRCFLKKSFIFSLIINMTKKHALLREISWRTLSNLWDRSFTLKFYPLSVPRYF